MAYLLSRSVPYTLAIRMHPRCALHLGFGLLFGLLSATSSEAQTPSPAPRLEGRVPIDSAVRAGRLANGLTYYIRENHEPRARAELRLVVNAGSILEGEDQRGLAHLVEHMAFNGTRSFGEDQIVRFLESVGMRFGPDINAYTGFDETVYTLTLPTDSAEVLDRGVHILREWAGEIAFDSVEIRKERPVVIEEWRLGRGAESRLRDRQLPVLFQGSRYADRLPIGSLESLQGSTEEALARFYREWYRPELMAVIAVGAFDALRMEGLIRTHFSTLPASPASAARPVYPVPDHLETLFTVAADPEATRASVAVYHKLPRGARGTVEAYRQGVIEALYLGMLGVRLSEISQRPDAPFLFASASSGSLARSKDVHVLSASVRESAVTTGLEALLTEAERAARHGFTVTELERQKEQLLRLWEQAFAERDKTHSGQYAAEYVAHFLEEEAIPDMQTEFALYRRFIPEIALQEVNDLARERIREGSRVVTVSLPEKEGLAVPTEAELRAALERVAQSEVAAYEDRTSSAPLVAIPPTGGRIVAERTIPEIGVTEWTLSNGAKVVVKATDFREDEFLFAATSPGGLSLAPDSLWVPAMTAAGVVQQSGAGELDLVELGKRLSGKLVGVGASIGELREGFSGGGSPRDIETLLQLVHLYFTAPRADTAAFLAYQERGREALRSRAASPEAAFSDTLRLTLAQNHLRARPTTSETFAEMDLHQSLAFYRERFADAGDFTFYFVGNVDPAGLRPLVERWLAGLPSTGRQESGRDLGMRPPRGVVRKTVLRGLEPKARTQIVFTGPLEFSHERVGTLSALGEVMRIRLREVLREELGGTYGVGVSASAARDPVPGYTVGIGFGAAPERLRELNTAVLAQIDSLKRTGPTAEELRKVKEARNRSFETDLRDNSFWISQLLYYGNHDWDPRGILRAPERTEALDAETIRDAARSYLDTENLVQVTLLPEAGG